MPPQTVTINAFPTTPDGQLIDFDSFGGNTDTGLGVRVKSTGEWVATNDDDDVATGGGIYSGYSGNDALESQITFSARPGVEYEAVVGAYSDTLPLDYGVSMTADALIIPPEIGGNTIPLNQNAATALGITVPAEYMPLVDPDGSIGGGSGMDPTGGFIESLDGQDVFASNNQPADIDDLSIAYTDGTASTAVPQIFLNPEGYAHVIVDTARFYQVTHADGTDLSADYATDQLTSKPYYDGYPGGQMYALPDAASGQTIRVNFDNSSDYVVSLVSEVGNIHSFSGSGYNYELDVPDDGMNYAVFVAEHGRLFADDGTVVTDLASVSLEIDGVAASWGDFGSGSVGSGAAAVKLGAAAVTLGALAGAEIVETDDGSVLTLTVAEASEFYTANIAIANGYAIVDGGPEVMAATSPSMPANAVSVTAVDVTVDVAMGLVSLQDTSGANLDFSIATGESLSDLSVMQATAAVEATNVDANDVSVRDTAGMVVGTPGTGSIDLAAVQQVTVTTTDGQDLTTSQYSELANLADGIELNGSVTLSVDQAGSDALWDW